MVILYKITENCIEGLWKPQGQSDSRMGVIQCYPSVNADLLVGIGMVFKHC